MISVFCYKGEASLEDRFDKSRRDAIKEKLWACFDGKIVWKDLTKKIKQNVKRILADNFVRPDEAQKVLAKLHQNGSRTVIDMITVHLDIKFPTGRNGCF